MLVFIVLSSSDDWNKFKIGLDQFLLTMDTDVKEQ